MKEEVPDGFDEERDDPRLDQAFGNYLSLDRIDLQFASKEACRQMSDLGSVVRPE